MIETRSQAERVHFIDWLRVIAIGILLVFHIMVMYQPYANMIRFIQSPVLLAELMVPLTFFSIMRIPLLFFVSGMGVYFSLQKRNWIQLLLERTRRILVPLIFGSLAIVPWHKYIYTKYYNEEFSYTFDFSHLWFLMNICIYILWFFAIFYFNKEIKNSKFVHAIRSLIERNPLFIFLFMIPYILQAFTIPSDIPYALYFDSRVGLLLGAVAFILGYTFMLIGDVLWQAIAKIKYYTLALAIILYCSRMLIFEGQVPHYVSAFESITWIFTAFGLGYRFLNKPGKLLEYLSPAAYPIYIIHMIFLYLGAYLMFPLDLSPWITFVSITILTFSGCFIIYEVIRRVIFLRPLFGLKIRK